jgi:hypothetical protein
MAKKPEKSREELRSLRNSAAEIQRESYAGGLLPHYCAALDFGPTRSKLVLRDTEIGMEHIYFVSPYYLESSKQGRDLHVTMVATGIRVPSDHKDWSLLQLFVKCRPMEAHYPVDVCVWAAFPSSWSKKMYCAALLGVILKGESHEFTLHTGIRIGTKQFYTVSWVHNAFNLSIPEFLEHFALGLEVVEETMDVKYLQDHVGQR